MDCGECFPSVSPFKWAGRRLLWIWLVFTIYCTAPYLSSSSENPPRIINCRVGSGGEEISRNPLQKSWVGNMGKYWWAATSAPPPLGPRDQLSSSGLGTGLLGPKDQTAPNKTPPAQTICAPHLCIFIHLDLDDFLAEYRSFQRGLFCPASSSSCWFCILKRVFSNWYCVVDVFFENVFDIVGCLIGHVVSRSWCKGPKGALM